MKTRMTMKNYSALPPNPFFRISCSLAEENRGDNKVALISEIDMSSAQRLRDQIEANLGIKPSYTALVAKAISLALRRHPHTNRIAVGFFRQYLVQLHDVDMSVAVEQDVKGAEQAVFVGTIRHTDQKTLDEITKELRGLAAATPETNSRWRLFKWMVEKLPSWLTACLAKLPKYGAKLWVEHRGGAALISSPSKYGVDTLVAAWPWPLGFTFGLVKDRPFVIDGVLTVRPTMSVTLSFDRRMMGGAPASRFFATVLDYLTNAEHYLPLSGDQINASDEYEGNLHEKRKLTGRATKGC